jgi:hypothetical protein
LSRPALAVKVRAAVRDYAPTVADAAQVWSAVRENAVLAGQVRGLLNALRAETRDNRDSAMWEFKISAVLDLLAAEQRPSASTASTARHSPTGRRRSPTSGSSDALSTRREVAPSEAGTPDPAPSPTRDATAGPRSAAVPAIEFVEPSAPAHRSR